MVDCKLISTISQIPIIILELYTYVSCTVLAINNLYNVPLYDIVSNMHVKYHEVTISFKSKLNNKFTTQVADKLLDISFTRFWYYYLLN
jgi:hypothetical protein